MEYKEKLKERFFRYLSIESQSDASSSKLPSSEGQMTLAKMLKEELKELGLSDIRLNNNAILTACLKGNMDHDFKVGFVAHLDTVDVGLSPAIKPKSVLFDGSDIVLNQDENIVLKVDEHPEILPYEGDEIIVSDGTSVLGADNKSAIANVMTMLEILIKENRDHGDIHVAFVPDEEIGLRGAKAMNLKEFPVDFAYTIDSCEIGEVVYETFNAGTAIIHIEGVTAHPMSSKGVLINPVLLTQDIISQFDRKETPECTEGKEGYIWVKSMNGNDSKVVLEINIRDFDKRNFEKRKQIIQDAVVKVQDDNTRAKINCEIMDVYGNISDSLKDNKPVDIIYEAMNRLGIKSKTLSMRGGTDGSALSARGLPTPNYFTGAHNFHSIYEFLPMKSFEKSLQVSLEIVQIVKDYQK